MNPLPNISSAKEIALDLETHDPDLKRLGPGGVRNNGFVRSFSVACTGHGGSYPVDIGYGEGYTPEELQHWFKDTFADNTHVVGANLLYDLEWLQTLGINVKGKLYDVQYAEALLDENKHHYNLDALITTHLPGAKNKIAFGFPKDDPRDTLWPMPPPELHERAVWDAESTLLIHHKQAPLLHAQGLSDLYDLECRLMPLMLQMRMGGVRIDVDALDKLEKQVRIDLKTADKHLDYLAGYPISANSNSDLKKLFDREGLTYSWTDADPPNPSFAAPVLEPQDNDICRTVLKVRQLTKMLNTFISGIAEHMYGDRVHCVFHPLKQDEGGTVTGRYSCRHPNLQNQYSRDPVYGRMIRSLFLPEEGEDWLKRDYSQVEFRVLVHYAAACGFASAFPVRDAYHDDPTTDFHAWVADLIKKPRSLAKNINFGLVYGMGYKTFACNAGITVETAKAHFKHYHRTLDFVRCMSDLASNRACKNEYITTLLGRRRRFPVDPEGKPNQYTYKALNALVQGSAADIIKKAMYECHKSGVFDVLKPLLTVHDEVDTSKPRTKEGEEASAEMKHIMENCVSLEVPLLVGTETGPNWWDVK